MRVASKIYHDLLRNRPNMKTNKKATNLVYEDEEPLTAS